MKNKTNRYLLVGATLVTLAANMSPAYGMQDKFNGIATKDLAKEHEDLLAERKKLHTFRTTLGITTGLTAGVCYLFMYFNDLKNVSLNCDAACIRGVGVGGFAGIYFTNAGYELYRKYTIDSEIDTVNQELQRRQKEKTE